MDHARGGVMARILLVGTATLDIVYQLSRYPQEDDEMRAQGLRICRGGNAANTAVVLAQLGHVCSFAGVLADAPESSVITEDFTRYGIDFSPAVYRQGKPPTSSIYLVNASRTIVHCRDLVEFDDEMFGHLDLTQYDWVHFEGRNIDELEKMILRVRRGHPLMPVSLEVEKTRDGIERLFPLANLLLFSRGYAKAQGYDDAPEAFLAKCRQVAPLAISIVGWGERGAYGIDDTNSICHASANPPQMMIDTLGAGDTFNAGVIDAGLHRNGLALMLQHACRLAGIKCGKVGFCL